MNEEDILKQVHEMVGSTMLGALGIRFTRIRPGYLEATMPVDDRTRQPYGLLHGGASAALAETLGSFGSHLLVQDSGGLAVGVELNINHLKSKRGGEVTGKATILHQGKRTHVWNIEIADEEGHTVAVSRLTVMIREGRG
ncbi:MAG: PaaI family thioesterase [Flavobacteriales bacterium]|jgi:1,4-dihydroxy-2-naphthoyl-CoA hydrolase